MHSTVRCDVKPKPVCTSGGHKGPRATISQKNGGSSQQQFVLMKQIVAPYMWDLDRVQAKLLQHFRKMLYICIILFSYLVIQCRAGIMASETLRKIKAHKTEILE
eukprot:g42153.t1